ncbi:hypothetical protein [Rufibacter sp. LB8]|uniref:hypothetical protein n=1 Tax=Rufibacter sp. LB8 TaxID=2777781 RepID=UPI00178C7E0F|nr:hypothetical protein [Rufibacter sp. LB8]
MRAINPDQIESIQVFKGKSAVDLYGEKAKDGAIVIEMKTDAVTVWKAKSENDSKVAAAIRPKTITLKNSVGPISDKSPLYLVKSPTGDIALKQEMLKTINPEWIQSIDVLKSEAATALYEANGKNGVVLISIKPAHQAAVEELLKKTN